MILKLEYDKTKRTGFLPAFICGGLIAAAVPVLNMSLRAELYLSMPGSPLQILLDANWQVMAMLNLLLISCGACLLYHTEYADNALQKMRTLPVRESRLFWGKVLLLVCMCVVLLAAESAGIAFCCRHWFPAAAASASDIARAAGLALAYLLPTVMASLFIVSLCRSLWTSLGICVLCVFTATLLPADRFIFSMFPFLLPLRTPLASADMPRYLLVIGGELFLFGLAESLFLTIRRAVS